mgnify:CR=1 FL=1
MQLRRAFDSLSPTNDARRLFDSRELLIGCVSNFPRRFSVHADLHDATCSLSSRRAQRHRRDARSRWDETNAFRCINVRNRTNLFVTHTHTRTSTERNFFFFPFFSFRSLVDDARSAGQKFTTSRFVQISRLSRFFVNKPLFDHLSHPFLFVSHFASRVCIQRTKRSVLRPRRLRIESWKRLDES